MIIVDLNFIHCMARNDVGIIWRSKEGSFSDGAFKVLISNTIGVEKCKIAENMSLMF